MYNRAKPEKSLICKHLRKATESVNAEILGPLGQRLLPVKITFISRRVPIA